MFRDFEPTNSPAGPLEGKATADLLSPEAIAERICNQVNIGGKIIMDPDTTLNEVRLVLPSLSIHDHVEPLVVGDVRRRGGAVNIPAYFDIPPAGDLTMTSSTSGELVIKD